MSFSYADFLRFLLSNLDRFDDIVRVAIELVQCRDAICRWDAAKRLGDILVDADTGAISVAAVFGAESVEDTERLEQKLSEAIQARQLGAEINAQAWEVGRIRKIWDALQPLLPYILPLIMGR